VRPCFPSLEAWSNPLLTISSRRCLERAGRYGGAGTDERCCCCCCCSHGQTMARPFSSVMLLLFLERCCVDGMKCAVCGYAIHALSKTHSPNAAQANPAQLKNDIDLMRSKSLHHKRDTSPAENPAGREWIRERALCPAQPLPKQSLGQEHYT
jgi:hypothetical protein